MNIKIIILGILLTALNANAENVNNCDSTCANNATINQMSSPMNTQTSTVGSGTVIQGNFYAVQSPNGAQSSDNSPPGTLCGFGTWMGLAHPCKGYTGFSCPAGYYFSYFTYTDGGKISHCVKQ